MKNPFCQQNDSDQHMIWNILVKRDIEAFEENNWDKTASDFSDDRFIAIHAHHSNDPDQWDMHYGSLIEYANDWLQQRKDFGRNNQAIALAQDLFEATSLDKIEIKGTNAIVHKKFDGKIRMIDEKNNLGLNWQSIYKLQKINGKWLIVGFVGYLPNK